MRYVFDTNTISWLLARDASVIAGMTETIKPADLILGCPVVWFEVQRGLLAKDARRQNQRFEALFATFLWQDFNRDDWRLAAELWTARRTQGIPIHDADLLIAAFARNRGATLVTDNIKDFEKLGVSLENWKSR